MRRFNKPPAETTVAVQGFGNAGSVIARHLFDGVTGLWPSVILREVSLPPKG
jgi:glutamate dehydrogenase/leucine dehydrogenase